MMQPNLFSQNEAVFGSVPVVGNGLLGLMPQAVNKIGSAASVFNVELNEVVFVVPQLLQPEAGDVIAVRILTENPAYGVLELPLGRVARLNTEDVMVGVVGARRALRGFVGEIPGPLAVGSRLNLLNMGGVLGHCTGGHNELGRAIEVEFLGAVVVDGQIANIKQRSLPVATHLGPSAPIIAVAGSCMNSGKTMVAIELIKQFSRRGQRVAAAKLSGVACLKDTLNMKDHGAFKTLSFHDCGLPSTVDVDDLAPVAKAVINELNRFSPDVIVVELGDGIMGGYNVESLLADEELRQMMMGLVFCASDFVGAWGGIEILRGMGHRVDIVSGACTDSAMGVDFIQSRFNVPAANAIKNGDVLYATIQQKIAGFERLRA